MSICLAAWGTQVRNRLAGLWTQTGRKVFAGLGGLQNPEKHNKGAYLEGVARAGTTPTVHVRLPLGAPHPRA